VRNKAGAPLVGSDVEHAVLLALLRLPDDAYGISIRDEIEARTGRAMPLSSIYSVLDRLERRRLVRSWMGEPTAERGGRRKRLFALQPRGRAALARAHQEYTALVEGVERLLKPS
jgi:DNA-binding PadR family transcriptional regulator